MKVHFAVAPEAPFDHIEAGAVVTKDGERHPVDAIIYGTGFQATAFLAPMKITGLNGLDLNEAWRDGAEAYKGICVSGFLSLFMLYGPNTNLVHSSIVFMLESQVRYVMHAVRTLLNLGLHFINVRSQRRGECSVNIQQQLKHSVWDAGCSSWYKTASGKKTHNWPGFTFSYRRMTRKLDLNDYELHPVP